MNIKDIKQAGNKTVKAYFSEHDQRLPMIGKFVHLRDADELASKGMVRFVGKRFLDHWNPEQPSVALTRIFVANDIKQLKTVEDGQEA